MGNTDYGKNTKKIVFIDTDHRHAQLILRLRHHGLTQSDFFRGLVGGYIEGDERIYGFVDEISTQSQVKKRRSGQLRTKGKQTTEDLGLSIEQVDDLFDLFAEEFPEL
tara:strand:+ start:6339 stop:6662 length:324 start_codon:yes stop_codon:yes gene_type:complete